MSNTLKTEAPKQARFPLANYQLRIMDEPEVQVSKAGNNMLVFTLECLGMVDSSGVLHPTAVVDKETVEFAGAEFQFWATWFMNEKTGQLSNIGLQQIHTQAQIPLEFEGIDEATQCPIINGQIQKYTGITLYAQCQSRETTAQGPDGKDLVNPITGEKATRSNRRIVQVY